MNIYKLLTISWNVSLIYFLFSSQISPKGKSKELPLCNLGHNKGRPEPLATVSHVHKGGEWFHFPS